MLNLIDFICGSKEVAKETREFEEQPKRLCIDCAHARTAGFHDTGWHYKCAHPKVASLVSGKAVTPCEEVRDFLGKCGNIASLFEQVEPGNKVPVN